MKKHGSHQGFWNLGLSSNILFYSSSFFPFFITYTIHATRPTHITTITANPNHWPSSMSFCLPSYLRIWQRKILSLISVFTLPLRISQRRYFPSLVFLYKETFLQLYAKWGNFEENVFNNEGRGFLPEGTWLGNRSREDVRLDRLQPRTRKKNQSMLWIFVFRRAKDNLNRYSQTLDRQKENQLLLKDNNWWKLKAVEEGKKSL